MKAYSEIENWTRAKLQEEYDELSPVLRKIESHLNRMYREKSSTLYTFNYDAA